MVHTHCGPGSSRGVAAFPGTQQFWLHRCIAPMNSTGCEGFRQGGDGDHHGSGGQGAHILREAASSIVLSEHDYVMADIKKEVIDWEDDGRQGELHKSNEEDDTDDEEEEEEDIDDYDEEEEEEDEECGRERWFNLSQLAEVRSSVNLHIFYKNILLLIFYGPSEKCEKSTSFS